MVVAHGTRGRWRPAFVTTPDYRDFVIATLADSEAELRDHVRALEADVAGRRLLLCAALDQLHALSIQLAQARRTVASLREWQRGSRAEVYRR
jgi:hypothetical protein